MIFNVYIISCLIAFVKFFNVAYELNRCYAAFCKFLSSLDVFELVLWLLFFRVKSRLYRLGHFCCFIITFFQTLLRMNMNYLWRVDNARLRALSLVRYTSGFEFFELSIIDYLMYDSSLSLVYKALRIYFQLIVQLLSVLIFC